MSSPISERNATISSSSGRASSTGRRQWTKPSLVSALETDLSKSNEEIESLKVDTMGSLTTGNAWYYNRYYYMPVHVFICVCSSTLFSVLHSVCICNVSIKAQLNTLRDELLHEKEEKVSDISDVYYHAYDALLAVVMPVIVIEQMTM